MSGEMQKFFLSLILPFIFITNCAFSMTSNEYVGHLEKKLFGVIYENENLDKRIDRIEMQIYDSSYKGSNEERLKKIYKIYPQESFEPAVKQQKSQVAQNYEDNYYEQEEKSDYNNYPIVSKIEQTIYQHDYQGEDIYKRLSRIETELYGHANNDMSLQQRVENLKSLLPKKRENNYFAQNYEFSDINSNIPYNYSYEPPKIYNLTSAIAELELQTFNKTFSGDVNEKRLERLESFYFGNSYNGKPQEERLAKLAGVVVNQRKNAYMPIPQGSQWAGFIINLLMIGLGFLL